MSDTPLVSVIVPAYNGERHIRQCVESVLAQTLADFELICVCLLYTSSFNIVARVLSTTLPFDIPNRQIDIIA